MSIQFQICGLCILLLLLIFYKSHKTLKLYKENIFYKTMWIMIVSLTLDILSLVILKWRQNIPELLVNLECKAYIVSLVWGACAAFIYVTADIFTEKKYKKNAHVFTLVELVQSIIVFVLPINIFDDGNVIYTYGPAVMCVYIFVAIYIMATITVACVLYKKMNPRRVFAVILWMVIWSASAIIQFINNSLLIVGFASAVGVLILFVIMENPEANLDRGLGCFNSYAMEEYINLLIERKQNFGILEISLEKPDLFEKAHLDANEVMRKMLHILQQDKDIWVFKNIDLSVVVVSEKMDRLEAAGNKMVEFFSGYEHLNSEVMLILNTRAADFENTSELSRFFTYICMKYTNKKGQLFIIDEDIVKKYKEGYLIEKEIKDALTEDRVEVFLQPIYSNQEKRFTSAEALVRIRKRDGQFLAPGVFIPIAENNGQIIELGDRVFEKVCAFLKNTNVIQLGVHYIEVNLSVLQCEQKDLAERVIAIVEKYDIDPNWINLEITETGSISAKETLLENMNRLIAYGFTFSLDDFGKGESNLMYVVEMPVSIVKLDYDISKAFFAESKAVHVVRAVVEMAHKMNLKLVAEGIETQEELDGMCRESIDYIQGFYYSKPLPMQEALHFYEQYN